MLCSKDVITFSSIFEGNIFLYKDALYMKCCCPKEKTPYNAVKIDDGTITIFNDDDWISKVECEIKIIIEKMFG